MRFLANSALVILLLASTNARGADDEQPTAVTPPPTVTIDSTSMDAVTDELVIRARITNKGTDAIVVTPTLEVPDDIILGPRTSQVSILNDTVTLTKDSFDVNGGESHEVVFKLAALGWRDAMRKLLFRYGEREVHLRVKYEITPGTVEHVQPTATESIRPQAPMLGVAVGALMGVIVTVGFVVVYRAVKQQPRMAFGEALLNVLLGSIAVVIAAVLFRYASVSLPQLPISVSVRDYIGGIVLGVLFQPLVDWFAKLVQVDTGAKRRKAESASSAVDSLRR